MSGDNSTDQVEYEIALTSSEIQTIFDAIQFTFDCKSTKRGEDTLPLFELKERFENLVEEYDYD